MISVNRRTLYGEVYNDVRCLSSDEKPTEGIKNGSTLIEIDTGARYLFDALSKAWNEVVQREGGGEGDPYVLPTMSATVKGGARLGSGLSITGDVLSVDTITVSQVHQITGV
jgi:hypothetical protein